MSGLAAGFSILESSGANAAAAAVAAGSYPITTASGAATVKEAQTRNLLSGDHCDEGYCRCVYLAVIPGVSQ